MHGLRIDPRGTHNIISTTTYQVMLSTSGVLNLRSPAYSKPLFITLGITKSLNGLVASVNNAQDTQFNKPFPLFVL